jgi:2-polyprenyl-3-methyl-5-hydroxy-6-metoxy-1,4-benzoquinol methylase
MSSKDHWENIYDNKSLSEVSWYQPLPETSINLVKEASSNLEASIIDIGGGDSFLAESLINEGYSSLTVLDISSKALERAKERLGNAAKSVDYIATDILNFNPSDTYEVWHDRAAFHFLTEKDDVDRYVKIATNSILPGGSLILGTFAENGPDKCSGIIINKYSIAELSEVFSADFDLINGFNQEHDTPFDTIQNFTFIHLKKKK